MPQNQIKQFYTENLTILDENGNFDNSLKPELNDDQIKQLYELMLTLRLMDEKLFNLQRSGKIGTYAQTKGQEASEIGSGFALEERDWFVPSFREMGVYLARGVDKVPLVQGWNGDTRAFKMPENGRNLGISIPIASQCLHATGLAWASKIKKEDECTIVYFGEGATSEGDFHEAMNFASVYNLPIVFFCQKNGWSISTPTNKEMHSETIAQKAISYDMDGIQIDGNDVFAVYKATKEALDKARSGKGPTLIESVTYRMGDHTTSDDSLKYRTEEEIKSWGKKDPLVRLEKYLQKNGLLNDEFKQGIIDKANSDIENAVEKGLSVEAQNPQDMFNDVFDKKPWFLEEQEKELMDEINQGGNN